MKSILSSLNFSRFLKGWINIPIAMFLGLSTVAHAQSVPFKDELTKLQASSDSLVRNHPVEKAYIQFDKPWYAIGDTIWFKAYVLNSYLMPSGQSKIINIDIANDSNKVIRQYRLPVVNGLTWGNIGLDEKDGL